MDWKQLQSKTKIWADKTKDFAHKSYETGKIYTEKAKEQGYDTLVHGKTGISTVQDFEMIRDEKRLAIFCIEQNAKITNKMLLIFPIVLMNAWKESGMIRVIDQKDTDDLRNTLEITTMPTILMYEK